MLYNGLHDPVYEKPYTDVEEWRDKPVRHYYVHGGFKGTEGRFALYFPEKMKYENRFFQYLAPIQGDENAAQNYGWIEDKISFSILHGAYYVESNMGGDSSGAMGDPTIIVTSSAATAQYSRQILPLSTTDNFDERNFILSWNGLGQGFGALPVVFLGTMMITGSMGYGGAAAVFSLLAIVLALIPSLVVKERNIMKVTPEAREKYTLRAMLGVLKQMPELTLLLLGTLLWGLFYTTGYTMFVAYYIFDDANLSVIIALLGVIPTVIMVPLLPIIFKRVDKIVVARIACITFALCGILICLLGPEMLRQNLLVLYILTMVQTLGYTMVMFSCSQLPPDLAEMARYRTGQDVGGIVSASYNFITKLVNSLVSSGSLLILGAYGFQSVEAVSFEELAQLNAQGIGVQTQRALEGLWNVAYLFPLIGFAAAALVFFFVRVDRRKVRVYMRINSGHITREMGEQELAKIHK